MDASPCPGCGRDLPLGGTICPACGFDLTTGLAAPPRAGLLPRLAATAWRALLYGALLALPLVGFARLRATGPGPDLPTTLRWMVRGDSGRAEELTTIHRAHEIAAASARVAIETGALPAFTGDWAPALAPYATVNVRGYVPLLFWASTTELAPAEVREPFEIRSTDGWGRPYLVASREVGSGAAAAADPEVAADLARGLQASFFAAGRPDLARGDWARLEVASPGRDGAPGTADDLRLVSYMPLQPPLALGDDRAALQRRVEEAFTVGRHYFRVEGSRHDLVDARLLAEFRLVTAGRG